MNVPKEKFMKVINQIWKLVNKNGDEKITCLELGQAVFGIIDKNGDGTLDFDELKSLVKSLAGAMHVKLSKGYTKKVRHWFKAVDTNGNKGVEFKEIIAFLETPVSKLHVLKDAIHSLGE